MNKYVVAALLCGAVAGCSDIESAALREPCLRILDVHLGMNISDVEDKLGLKIAEEHSGTRTWRQTISGDWGEHFLTPSQNELLKRILEVRRDQAKLSVYPLFREIGDRYVTFMGTPVLYDYPFEIPQSSEFDTLLSQRENYTPSVMISASGTLMRLTINRRLQGRFTYDEIVGKIVEQNSGSFRTSGGSLMNLYGEFTQAEVRCAREEKQSTFVAVRGGFHPTVDTTDVGFVLGGSYPALDTPDDDKMEPVNLQDDLSSFIQERFAEAVPPDTNDMIDELYREANRDGLPNL